MSQEIFPLWRPVVPLLCSSRVLHLVTALLLLLPCLVSALDVPPLNGRINDLANILSRESASRLERNLADFERQTSTQIVVLTIPTLQGDDVAAFAIRAAEQWQLGQKGKDNGILLIIARGERKVRIEVGKGLQGALPDITAARIIRDVMRPHLQRGDYDRGVGAGLDAIMAATKGEFTAPPHKAVQRPHRGGNSFSTLLAVTVAVAVICGMIARRRRSAAGAAGAVGAVGLPLATSMILPGLGLATLLLLALAGLVAGIVIGLILSGMGGGGFGGGGYWGGGYWGGGFGGRSGGSGGDDSFSGGGGGFDGGGSSDDY